MSSVDIEQFDKQDKLEKTLEWTQTIMGVSAALIIASNLGSSFILLAMFLFMIKDTIMIIWSKMKSYKGLFVNSIAFLGIDFYGIYNWW